MFSKRKSRQVSDAPYTGVSGIPGNRASTNAHAAASAIAIALKQSNGSAVDMKLPPTQERKSSLLRNSNSFRGSLRTSSIRSNGNPYHSRSNSLNHQPYLLRSPVSTPKRSSSDRLSLTPQSLRQLNEQNDLRSIGSDISSDYGDADFATSNRKNGVKHKVSFSDASSEISASRAPLRHSTIQQQRAPTRQKTIKKYVPSANGLVVVEVPVEEEQARLDSIKAASRTSSLRGAAGQRRPVSRSSSLTGLSHKTREKVYYDAIPEEPQRGNADLNNIEQVKERLQRERQQLEQQYLAKIEEERLYQERIEKERADLERAEKERLQREYEDRQKQIEEEKKLAAAAAATAEAEEALELENQRQEELRLQKLEEDEASAAAAAALKEQEPPSPEIEVISVHPIESTVTEDHDEDLFKALDDKESEKIITNGGSSAELDLVNGYHGASNDSLPLQNNDSSSKSAPTSAELSENLGTTTTTTATDITEIDEGSDETPTDNNNNHLSMAKQLRSAMLLPSVLVNDVAAQETEIPPRSERRLSVSSSQGTPLSRKKSALKRNSKYDNTSPSKSPSSAAAQAYLSLTTAENTRLNALNTQSSLSLSLPEAPFQQQQQQQRKRLSPKQQQQPRTLRPSQSPVTPKNNRRTMVEDPYNKPRPITINLPQQVSPGKFVLPKSDAKKKADALFKKANSKPRQAEEELRRNLPPLQRKSSFEKESPQPAQKSQQRLSMRPDPNQYDVHEYASQPTQTTNVRSNGVFKSRFADSDSDDDGYAPPTRHHGNEKSFTTPTKRQYGTKDDRYLTPPPRRPEVNGKVTDGAIEDEKKKKKFGGKLKKLFGRS